MGKYCQISNDCISNNEFTMMGLLSGDQGHIDNYNYHFFILTKNENVIFLHITSLCAKIQHILLKYKSEQEGENEKNDISNIYHV